MKHVIAVIIKFVMASVILEIVLSFLTVLTFGQILMISLAVTAVSYIIGDLLVLSFSNNTVATLADALLAFAVIFLFNYRYGIGIISYTNAIIASVVLAVGEWFFHKYVSRAVFPNHRRT
jgi:Protein of unknown function (DUF2512).